MIRDLDQDQNLIKFNKNSEISTNSQQNVEESFQKDQKKEVPIENQELISIPISSLEYKDDTNIEEIPQLFRKSSTIDLPHQSSTKTPVPLRSTDNVLQHMKHYYQMLYSKLAQVHGKTQKSKRKLLLLMAQQIAKRYNLTDISLHEIVIHLGSIIYPSKKLKNFKIGVEINSKEKPKEALRKAELLIIKFHKALFQFSAERLSSLLESPAYRALYEVFCQNLEFYEMKKEDVVPVNSKSSFLSVNLLTQRLSAC